MLYSFNLLLFFLYIYRQLGLIDTIYVDGGQSQNNNTSTKSSKSKLSLQSYEYVIAVDFEATCWENKAPPKWRESEIIGRKYLNTS